MNIIRPLLTLGFLLGFLTLAQAHAFLDHADPRVGSTLNVSPTVVKIWFTMDVQGSLSNIKVFNATGQEVDKKDAKVDRTDGALMCVSLPPLPAGSYKVVWNAVCPFGHHTNGTFTFAVRGP